MLPIPVEWLESGQPDCIDYICQPILSHLSSFSLRTGRTEIHLHPPIDDTVSVIYAAGFPAFDPGGRRIEMSLSRKDIPSVYDCDLFYWE
jgi:hypothetical protein